MCDHSGTGELTEIPSLTAEEETNTLWKLTLVDKNNTFKLDEDGSNLDVNAGDTMLLNYSGYAPEPNTYISALISDNKGKDLYYGRLSQPATTSGTVSLEGTVTINGTPQYGNTLTAQKALNNKGR